MQLSGNYSFDADQETVWNLLMDTDAIAVALPGVNELIPVEGETDKWSAEAKLTIGSIGGTYTGTIQISEKTPPNQYRLTVNGQGQQSIIDGTTVITLTYDEEKQATQLHWEAESQMSGKLARVGQRVINATANMMSKRFFKALEKQLSEKLSS